MAGKIEVEPGPARPGNRPFVLVPLDEAACFAYLELHTRLPVPAVALAFQEMREKAFLQPDAVVGVEGRPVLDAVRLEPLVRRRGPHEPFEIAARMQSLPAPVRRREERHGHLVPRRRACLVIIVVERMREDLVAQIAAILAHPLDDDYHKARSPAWDKEIGRAHV